MWREESIDLGSQERERNFKISSLVFVFVFRKDEYNKLLPSKGLELARNDPLDGYLTLKSARNSLIFIVNLSCLLSSSFYDKKTIESNGIDSVAMVSKIRVKIPDFICSL